MTLSVGRFLALDSADECMNFTRCADHRLDLRDIHTEQLLQLGHLALGEISD